VLFEFLLARVARSYFMDVTTPGVFPVVASPLVLHSGQKTRSEKRCDELSVLASASLTFATANGDRDLRTDPHPA
jgi:hypothetical protein